MLPDSVSYEAGTFVEPLGCVVRAQTRAGVRPGSTVLVIGSGISGLLHIRLAAALGAGRVFATDVSEYRLDWARSERRDGVRCDRGGRAICPSCCARPTTADWPIW